MATIPGGIFDQGGIDPAALVAIDALLAQRGLTEADFQPHDGGFEPVSSPYIFLEGSGDGAIIGGDLAHGEVMVGAARHLGQVGDGDHLSACAETAQELADHGGGGAADADIHFVERPALPVVPR